MDSAQASDKVQERVKRLIRDVPDYPKPGIVFKDITPLLGDARARRALTDYFRERLEGGGRTFRHEFDVASRKIPDPSRQPETAGFFSNEPPEADPLHAA